MFFRKDKVHHRMSFLENQLRSGREESNADITTIMRNVEAKLTEIAFNGNSNARTVKPRMGLFLNQIIFGCVIYEKSNLNWHNYYKIWFENDNLGQSVTSKQNTSSPCTEMKDIVRRSASKVDSIFTILTTEHSGKGKFKICNQYFIFDNSSRRFRGNHDMQVLIHSSS